MGLLVSERKIRIAEHVWRKGFPEARLDVGSLEVGLLNGSAILVRGVVAGVDGSRGEGSEGGRLEVLRHSLFCVEYDFFKSA